MLLPLLAMPLRNPLTNLLVQMGLSTFAALVSMCLLARYTLPRGLWQLAALLSAAGFLALAPEWMRFEILAVQPYGLSQPWLSVASLSLSTHIVGNRAGALHGIDSLAPRPLGQSLHGGTVSCPRPAAMAHPGIGGS